jgi:glutamyl-tRNA reductase
MESIQRKLPHLSERDLKVLQKHTKSIVNQLLRDPIMKVKEMGISNNSGAELTLFKEIFNLVDEPEEKENAQKQSQQEWNPAQAYLGNI